MSSITGTDKSPGEIPFPRFIDKPRLIGVFEVDEFAVMFSLLAFVITLSLAAPNLNSTLSILIAIVIAQIFTVLYRRYKRNRPDGFAFQKLYRLGIVSPTDMKQHYIKYPYLSKIGRVVPYGFTVELLN